MTQDGRPVSIFTLGAFAVVCEGQRLCFKGKAPHKPIELLQALIARGGCAVSTMQLFDDVWPDHGSVDPANLFDNTLHRLRHLLGHRDALMLADSKLTLNAGRCWVDACEFDRLAKEHLDRTPTAAASSAPLAAIPAAVDALELYQGDFLQHELPQPWHVQRRARLRSLFERLLLHHGEHLESAQRWADAAAWYARGLEIDPFLEVARQQLMSCDHKLGHDADALRTYWTWRDLLARTLGVSPSPAIEAIVHSIVCAGRVRPALAHAPLT